MTDDELVTFEPLDRVRHLIFGEGYVVSRSWLGDSATVKIKFDDHGTKELLLSFAADKLELL